MGVGAGGLCFDRQLTSATWMNYFRQWGSLGMLGNCCRIHAHFWSPLWSLLGPRSPTRGSLVYWRRLQRCMYCCLRPSLCGPFHHRYRMLHLRTFFGYLDALQMITFSTILGCRAYFRNLRDFQRSSHSRYGDPVFSWTSRLLTTLGWSLWPSH